MTPHVQHILGIEISNPGAGVRASSGPSVALGLLRDGAFHPQDCEWLRPTAPGSRGGIDDDLMPALQRLFTRLGEPPRRVLNAGRIAVSVGPGGYTSVRIACAAGKMIAEACTAACVSVGTEVALSRAARRQRPDGIIAVALAGKGESAWVHVMESGQPGRVVDADGLKDLCRRHHVRALVADEHLPRAMRAAAEQSGIEILPPVYDAMIVAELGAELPTRDAAELNPVYPREPDAVTQWRARKG